MAALLTFCTCTPRDYSQLMDHIHACAQRGCSYEFVCCALLPGCAPASGTIGFWRDGGGYLLYVRPRIAYSGGNSRAADLFEAGQKRFAAFGELTAFLQALGREGTPPAVKRRDRPAPLRAGEARPGPTFRRIADALGQVVLGQEAAVEAAAFKLYAHVGKERPLRPASLLLYGPTGVGKSELGKAVAPVLSRITGKEYQLVWTELNTFSQAHSVYRLTGAPPGYVGYDDQPVFEAVRRNPRTVFMFDELDKAHPEVLKAFMSILDEGRCSAHRELEDQGRELDFRRSIFLFTTNADLSGGRRRMGFGTEEAPAAAVEAAGADSLWERIYEADERGRRAMVQDGVLREIAGRFGGFVPFRPLDGAARRRIVEKQIFALGAEYGLNLVSAAPELVDELLVQAEKGGALSVRSYHILLEGCLTEVFLEQAGRLGGIPVKLEGTAREKRLVPVWPTDRSGRRATA